MVDLDIASAHAAFKKTEEAIHQKNIEGKNKAQKYQPFFLNHCLKIIKKASAKGEFWILYCGPWYKRLNEFTTHQLILDLRNLGFTVDTTDEISLLVKWRTVPVAPNYRTMDSQ